MAQTMIERIIAAHSSEKVEAGRIVWMDLDVRSARDFGGANVVNNFRKHYPGEKVHDPGKTFFTFDCVVPAKTIPYAENQHTCRIFAREQGIRVYDVDAGIGSHVMVEEGLALPGSTVVGTDSHLNIMGAIGAFGQGMGDQDIAFGFKAGKTWFEVPATMRIAIEGDLPDGATAKDLTLAVVRKLGSSGALGKAIEFYGDAIDDLDLAGRITLASMATEMGAIIGLIPPSVRVLEKCGGFSGGKKFEPQYAEDRAKYAQEIKIDISDLRPLVARPPRPDNIVEAAELKDVKVDSVFIGSCTNGTYEDLRSVAEIVTGRTVAKGLMAKVVPATRKVFTRLLKEGLIEKLHDAGFIVSNPGCGGCASGQIGMTGKGEVQVSTSNRNFTGKQGAGDTYLASPAVAATSAVLGRIGTVEDLEGGG